MERREADTFQKRIQALVAPKIYAPEEIMEQYREF